MIKKMKRILVCIFAFAVVYLAVRGGIYMALIHYHYAFIVTAEPDAREWNLTNDIYRLEVTDKEIDSGGGKSFTGISFKVYSDDTLVYECKEAWRKWDLKSMEILKNNNIVVDSSDIGTSVYIYKNGDWFLAEDDFD